MADKLKCTVPGCEFEGDSLDLMNHLQLVHKLTDKQAMEIVYPGGAPVLKDAAKDAGAVEVIDKDGLALSELEDSSDIAGDVKEAFEKAPTTQDIIGTGKIEFHKELPQIKFEDLIGHSFLIYEIFMVEEWEGYYGTSDFGLILLQLRDGRKATSLAGGVAVIKQLRGFKKQRRYPVKVVLGTKPGEVGPYYIFE